MTLSIHRRSELNAAVFICLLLMAALNVQASEIQSLTSIRLQAESFIVDHPYESPYPARFQFGNLDSRLRLKACREQLTVEFAHLDKIHGNTALLVRCPVTPAWKIHLPVRIDVFDDVAVTAIPLLKGQKLDESAFTFQKHNITRLKNGYYAKNRPLHQLQARRNLGRGTVLTPANLDTRMLVRSGQQVTLVLNYNGIQIKSTGKALKSAGLGQVVRVRNSQSSKIVEGVVSGEALVRVGI
jgi:flagella basal body P-ring formation protein FlgA